MPLCRQYQKYPQEVAIVKLTTASTLNELSMSNSAYGPKFLMCNNVSNKSKYAIVQTIPKVSTGSGKRGQRKASFRFRSPNQLRVTLNWARNYLAVSEAIIVNR